MTITVRSHYIATRCQSIYQIQVRLTPTKSEGALIAHIEPYSPAYDAALRKSYILEEIDGNKINDPPQVSSQVRKKRVSDQISMTVRYGGHLEVPLQLKART
jgi:S1-C subfamily serine protease